MKREKIHENNTWFVYNYIIEIFFKMQAKKHPNYCQGVEVMLVSRLALYTKTYQLVKDYFFFPFFFPQGIVFSFISHGANVDLHALPIGKHCELN